MTSEPTDDHRYYRFPYMQVFEGALQVLRGLGLHVTYGSMEQGRVIASGVLGYLDLRLVSARGVTLVHARAGSHTMTGGDRARSLRRRFFWELDEWLHRAGPGELLRAHRAARRCRGRGGPVWVPAGTAYRLS